MTKRDQVFKCAICTNIIEVLHEGAGELVCCNQPMKYLEENTVDAAKEKHVPVIEKIDGGYKVKLGEVAHPMEEKHFIEWIELVINEKVYRKYLVAGDNPEASFQTDANDVEARAYCNLHGLWKG